MSTERYDLAVIGAGIVGLAHALAASRRGMRVVAIDRDARSNGASVRNFGFITVTGQSAGPVWRRALRTRDIWTEVAHEAGIPVVHQNECVLVHSCEAIAVLEQFAATEMGEDCELLTAGEARSRVPMSRAEHLAGALWSPHDLRIEPRIAIPALEQYLQRQLGVTFLRGVAVRAVETPNVPTSDGCVSADRVVVAPGPDLVTLFPSVHARRGVRLCKLHMLRLVPQPRDWRLPASIMSDFGLIRYAGFSALPAAATLRSRLAGQQPELLAHGIHLIVVQNADGSLVVGDSHEYAMTPDPFYSSEVEAAMLGLASSVLEIPTLQVVDRWIGVYPQSDSFEWFVDAPDRHTRVVQITTGNGMSTAFGLAEEVIADLQ